MFLLDTDVLSSLRRRQRASSVVAWFRHQRPANLFISVISIGEIEGGIARQRSVNPDFADALTTWLDDILAIYGNRVLPFDLPAAKRWGELSAAIGSNNFDLMIAATALEHGLTAVTRNVHHFAPTGVPTFNPFELA